MSDEGNRVSADPSIMQLMADHYVPNVRFCNILQVHVEFYFLLFQRGQMVPSFPTRVELFLVVPPPWDLGLNVTVTTTVRLT